MRLPKNAGLLLRSVILIGLSVSAGANENDAHLWTRFSTRGHVKAGKVDLSIAYPNGWLRTEGIPKIDVQDFQPSSPTLVASVSMSIIVIPVPSVDYETFTVDAIKAMNLNSITLAQVKAIETSSTKIKIKLLGHKNVVVDDVPMGFVDYRQETKSEGSTVISHVRIWTLVAGSSMVEFMGVIAGSENQRAQLLTAETIYLPEFQAMVNSVRVTNKPYHPSGLLPLAGHDISEIIRALFLIGALAFYVWRRKKKEKSKAISQ